MQRYQVHIAKGVHSLLEISNSRHEMKLDFYLKNILIKDSDKCSKDQRNTNDTQTPMLTLH